MTADKQLKETLDLIVERFNVPSFADSDPVQFPRRYTRRADIEISAFLTSIISWGKRSMILRDAERLHALLGGEPEAFVLGGDIEAIPDDNIHRTFFGRHLRHALRGLRELYSRYGTLEAFANAIGAPAAEAPAWEIARAMNALFADVNAVCARPLHGDTRCLPAKVDASALKRFNMALRWLVRRDGIVDIGVWQALTPAQLFIPLDVHSATTSRRLGLLTRKANDRRAVDELTANLRMMRPDDPTVYDFALFGIGEAKMDVDAEI